MFDAGYSGIKGIRSHVVLWVRLAIFGIFVMLLAEPRAVRETDALSVMYVLDLSDSLGAFYTDMGTEMDNITILVVSEFGRTAHENDSKANDGTPTPGTDHGHAYCSFVIGGNINGGIYGGWPGLDPATQLAEGRYLAQKVDYRDVISECLSTLEGGTPEDAFEQYSSRTVVGFA